MAPRDPVYHREPKPPPQRHRSAHQHSSSEQSPRHSHHSYEQQQRHNPNHSRNHPDRQAHSHTHHTHRKIGTLTAHIVAASGEFIGTLMFLYFAFSCQIMLAAQAGEKSLSNRVATASSQTNVFTALVYGFSLLVNAWTFYRISGGLFNPAVTLGLVLVGAVPAMRALFLVPAQLLAAMSAAALVKVMFPGDIATTNTTLSPGVSTIQGVFIEMFMTAELVFVVLMLAVEKSKVTFLAPIAVGLALFIAMMGGVGYTGGSLNPARSLGPAVASKHFVRYHWIYWVGPFLGAIVAAGYYKFIKLLHYEEVNPGQDADNRDFPA